MTNIDEVRKLIEKGFDDLELIAFELDIPIEQVKQCKVDIEASKRKVTEQNPVPVRNIARTEVKKVNNINTGFNNEEYYRSHPKMDEIRDRFDELVYGKKKKHKNGEKEDKKSIKPKELSNKELELIEKTIVSIEGKIKEIKVAGKDRRKKSEIGREIVGLFKKIEGYQLSIGQAERIYALMNSRDLDRLKARHDDLIDNAISLVRRKIVSQFVEAINLKLAECSDIQELQDLYKIVMGKMAKEGQIFVGGLKSSISNKIMQLQQKQRIDEMRNNIPMNIVSVIQALASGKINMQDANEVIDRETKKRIDNGPQTRFALSEDAQKRQILMQIKTILVEKGDTYPVQDSETVIKQLQELCGIGQEEAIRIVVRNCIGKKDYEMARSVCDRNDVKNEYGFTVKSIASLRDEITHAEFADVVLEGMNNARTYQDEKAYINMIQKAINAGKIRATGVKLGKSIDGLKDVTLADVWDEERTKNFYSR